MTPIIDVETVHKHYPMDDSTVHALRGVSLRVQEGERVFLGGPSGCGKSTLLHLIGGLDRPSQGTVSVAGRRIDRTADAPLSAFRAASIGFVFQTFNLLPVLTVAENVEHPLLLAAQRLQPAERRKRVAAILDEVGLGAQSRQYPGQLSGGQRQRVAIARALVHEPLLLIADEPTANLDSETGEHVMNLMLDLSRKLGSTVLICTHNPGFLARAERVVRMHDGRIEADGRGPASGATAEIVAGIAGFAPIVAPSAAPSAAPIAAPARLEALCVGGEV